MASLRTRPLRLIEQNIPAATRRTTTTAASATIRPITCQYARQASTISRAYSTNYASALRQARHFTSHRSQQQREPGSSSNPSQLGTNPGQTPPSGSTPKPDQNLDSTIPPSKIYSFEDIQKLSSNPSPNRVLIDVREPSEILGTGRIPTSKNVPISSAPDSFFLTPEEFEDRFGFDRPTADQEVVFYCKAGVRSKAAARLAGQAGFGGKVGEFPGSWVEWFERGGKVERAEGI